MGRDVQIVKGLKGHLAFYGRHKTKDGWRAGIILDDAGKGKNNGTIGGHRYFTCKPEQGMLVDPKKVKLLPGNEERKKMWLTRAKHIKKLNRAFNRLMKSKEQARAQQAGPGLQVTRSGSGEIGKLKINEHKPTPDAGLKNRPILVKGTAVKKMEEVLKRSRKSVKKGGLNKYSGDVISEKRRRSEEVTEDIEDREEFHHSHYEENLFKASESTAEEMRDRAKQRAEQVLSIKEQEEEAQRQAEEEARLAAEEAEAEALTAAEEAAMQKAVDAEMAQLAAEQAVIDAQHRDLEEKVGVSKLSLKDSGHQHNMNTLTRKKSKELHPMLAAVDDFLEGDDFADDE